jgi:hypothetical protein
MYPEDAQIKKIEIGYDGDGCLIGFKWYDKHGKIALQTEWDWIQDEENKTHTELLADGERVLGFKSRIISKQYAQHHDFQFIFGR